MFSFTVLTYQTCTYRTEDLLLLNDHLNLKFNDTYVCHYFYIIILNTEVLRSIFILHLCFTFYVKLKCPSSDSCFLMYIIYYVPVIDRKLSTGF